MTQKIQTRKPIRLFVLLVTLIMSQAALAQTTAFTYQGRLTDAGNPANGVYDLQFRLFDALIGGNQVASTVIREDVAVSNGLFTVTLDFGAAAFPGANRWLEISVRPGVSTGAFTALSPLQPITATPYAVQSLNAANATSAVNFSGSLAGEVSGPQTATVITNNAVTTAKLTDGSVTDAKMASVAGSKVTGTIPVAGVPAGSTNYIQNSAILQASSNFNISGNGIIGGNLGIGTPTPATPLEVNGLLRSTRNGIAAQYLQLWGGDSASIRLTAQSTLAAEKPLLIQNLSGEVTPGNFNNIQFQVGTTAAPSTKMIIHQNGDVSIGADVAGVGIKLWVDGTIKGHSNNGNGVYGSSATSIGVAGTSDSNVGVFGYSSVGDGVVGWSNAGYAGDFIGKVRVTGVIEKAGGGFKIDHPLDPENKYLVHSFVESPDMKNLYDGTVTTDAQGEAEITLPDWFAALNRDFRYQLTCIGVFAQAIIAEKIKDNRFKIKTSLPNVEVSWQVTGTRQDAWANQNRLQVEELKPEIERGFYQNPSAFGQPEEKGTEWARRPEQMRQMKEQRDHPQPERHSQPAVPAARHRQN